MEEKKTTVMWELDVATLEEFYKRVALKGAQTEQEKVAILIQLAKEGRIKNAFATNRTKEEIIKDKTKGGWNVITPDNLNGSQNV